MGSRSRLLHLAIRVAAIALLVLAMAAPAPAADYTAGDKAFDAMVLRPMGFLGTAVGFVLFVASLPLSAPTLQMDQAWERFVQQPGDFTFHRELGDF